MVFSLFTVGLKVNFIGAFSCLSLFSQTSAATHKCSHLSLMHGNGNFKNWGVLFKDLF